MAEDNEHIQKLMKARDREVAQRRNLAEFLVYDDYLGKELFGRFTVEGGFVTVHSGAIANPPREI
jgi:hypothetical protein